MCDDIKDVELRRISRRQKNKRVINNERVYGKNKNRIYVEFRINRVST